ncbi:hypothetical protein [Nocardia sp. NPDC052112]
MFSSPEDGVYASTIRHRLGQTIVLPDPVGISMDIEPLKSWVR